MVDAGEPAPRARPRRAATRTQPIVEPSSDEDDDWVAAVDLDARQRLPKPKRPPPAVDADYEALRRRHADLKRAFANYKGDTSEAMYALRRKLAAADAEIARLRKRLRAESE